MITVCCVMSGCAISPQEQCNLATQHYSSGEVATAAKLYQMAADRGSIRAQYYFAVCRELGDGCPQNYDEAIKYYKKVTKHQERRSTREMIRTAYYNLARCYEYGHGAPRNHDIAMKYYKKAHAKNKILSARNKSSDAQGKVYYEQGMKEKLEEKSIPFFVQSASLGYIPAMEKLLGLSKNNWKVRDELPKIFEEARKRGSVSAYYYLGLVHYYKDKKMGIDMLRKGASLGDKLCEGALSDLNEK